MRPLNKIILRRGLAVGLLAFCGQLLAAVEYQYTVLEKDTHDPRIFTQGFVLDEGWFYESSGHYGRSFLVRYPVDGESGAEQRLALPRDIFAEGITVIDERLYLLSWKAGKAWVLDKNNFSVLATHGYNGEGWGLTHNGEHLIMSDGTDILRFYSIDDFALQHTVKVRLDGEPVRNLNELEYRDGLVWANQWQSNNIYVINAESGKVEAIADLEELQKASAARAGESVLNGIAYDRKRDAFWITGKYWRHRYLLQFESPQ
ncbi:MAG: glutaminyl-peptide cyclotransferase [Cellvibrionaceae bacterium]